MQPLRSARFLARLVLAWFVLAMGVAVASPMVQPHGLELVCAGGGLKLQPGGTDGEAPLAVGLDCPLCASAGAPPPVAPGLVAPSATQAEVAAPAVSAPLAAALPLPPARGPPARPVT